MFLLHQSRLSTIVSQNQKVPRTLLRSDPATKRVSIISLFSWFLLLLDVIEKCSSNMRRHKKREQILGSTPSFAIWIIYSSINQRLFDENLMSYVLSLVLPPQNKQTPTRSTLLLPGIPIIGNTMVAVPNFLSLS